MNTPIYKEANFWHVTYVMIGFIIVFTAFTMTVSSAAISMRTFGYDDLGFISQAALFSSFSVSSLFTSIIFTRLGAKNSLIICACLRMVWEASFLIPALKYERMNDGLDVSQFYY